jgi:L-threonylcarbamoyladenylate synthase
MAEIGKDILKAKSLLEQGKLVAIPTETVYGLAANALDAKAVARIFSAKKRPHFDPLIVHVKEAREVDRYAQNIPGVANVLIQKFWPGPLTLLLDKKEIIPDIVTSGLDRVGLRCPNHPITLELLHELFFPVAAPSANPFGYISPTQPQHVQDQLGSEVSYILDGGECAVGIESTIVGFENTKAIIYRVGGLSIEQVEAVTGGAEVKLSSSHPQAPGQLISHYAPKKPLLLGDIEELLSTHTHEKIAVLSFSAHFTSKNILKQIALSPSENLEEAAQNLFRALRQLDQSEAELIIAESVPDTGLGRAINDRLRRARVGNH